VRIREVLLPTFSYLVQVHSMCSTVKTHLQCLHTGAGFLRR